MIAEAFDFELASHLTFAGLFFTIDNRTIACYYIAVVSDTEY
jgi:hypothetical protein